MTLRPATPDDARTIAELTDMAGHGLPGHVWAASAGPGETPLDVGVRRAARDSGQFSWRNATIAGAADGQAAGLLITYPIADAPEPLDELPEAFRNLQALENMALSTLYVNVLAVYPAFRGQGLARALMAEAERQAGGRALSIIVADENPAAQTLYAALGYVERARLPVVPPAGWRTNGRNWLLLVKG